MYNNSFYHFIILCINFIAIAERSAPGTALQSPVQNNNSNKDDTLLPALESQDSLKSIETKITVSRILSKAPFQVVVKAPKKFE